MTRIAEPKKKPTQKVLGELYDAIDKAADFSEALAILLTADRSSDCIDTLAGDIEQKLKAIRTNVHDLVSWVE